MTFPCGKYNTRRLIDVIVDRIAEHAERLDKIEKAKEDAVRSKAKDDLQGSITDDMLYVPDINGVPVCVPVHNLADMTLFGLRMPEIRKAVLSMRDPYTVTATEVKDRIAARQQGYEKVGEFHGFSFYAKQDKKQ